MDSLRDRVNDRDNQERHEDHCQESVSSLDSARGSGAGRVGVLLWPALCFGAPVRRGGSLVAGVAAASGVIDGVEERRLKPW